MRVTFVRIALAGLVVVGVGACDYDTGEPESHPPPVVDSRACPVPEPPTLFSPEVVVGTGTAASCTPAALRTALQGPGQVRFDCGPDPVTIPVDSPLVLLDGTLLRGDGRVTLDGGGTTRILQTDHHATVIIDGMRFIGGSSRTVAGQEGANGSGGAIYRGWHGNLFVVDCVFNDNEADASGGFGGGAIGTASSGWLTVVRSTFTGNRSPYAGAIYSLLSDLTVIDSRFESNEATASDGGAIFTDGAHTPPGSEHGVYGGLIHVCGSQFLSNRAPSSAAAGFFFAYGIDQLVINRTVFRGNEVTTADPGLGGAIRIDAEAFVSNSLFVDNTNAGQGGALWMGRGPAIFENVTFYRNHAALWGGAISYGEKDIRLNNCTVARNTAGEGADALFGEEGALSAYNTLFAHNGDSGSARRHCNVSIRGGRNLAYPVDPDDACGTGLLHGDPKVASDIADLGGATQSLAIEEGSAAMDAGEQCPSTDQRGEPRDAAICDIGAFER